MEVAISLPFLKNIKDKASSSGVIIKTRTPDEKPEGSEPDDGSAAIDSCAAELIRAVHARDTKAVSQAIQDAFEILDNKPDQEETVEPHSYDSQTQD